MMTLDQPHGRAGVSRLRARLVLLAGAIALAGCTATEEQVPKPEVKVVEAYGQRLDASASPAQVAYLLLRSIRDDVEAAQAGQRQKQQEALRLTYSLAAYRTIEARLTELLAKSQPGKTSLGEQRDRQLYDFVKDWAPIAAHYVRSFDTDFERARSKMEPRPEPKNPDAVHVLYPVAHDPEETDPTRQQTALLDIELVREPAGGQLYWRVAKISYRGKPSPATRTATAAGA